MWVLFYYCSHCVIIINHILKPFLLCLSGTDGGLQPGCGVDSASGRCSTESRHPAQSSIALLKIGIVRDLYYYEETDPGCHRLRQTLWDCTAASCIGLPGWLLSHDLWRELSSRQRKTDTVKRSSSSKHCKLEVTDVYSAKCQTDGSMWVSQVSAHLQC